LTTSLSTITSLAGVLRHHGAAHGDRPALTARERTITYRQLDERSNQVAQALVADGLGRGHRVAFLDKNAPEFFEVLFACAKLGAVHVPVNWRLAGPEIAATINDSGAELLIVGGEYAPLIDSIAQDLVSVRKIVVVGDDRGHLAYDDWLSGREAIDPGHHSSPDDVVLQLYTSGTTGLPKGVMLAESNLMSLLPQGGPTLGLEPQSVNMVPMPLFHIGGSGYALIGFYAGCHTILIREVDPTEMLRVITQHRVTNTFVVPAVLLAMLGVTGSAEPDLSSLRTIAYGASPISVDVLTRSMQMFKCAFVQVYGLTETTGTVTLLTDEDHRKALAGEHPERLRSAGRPIQGAALRIVDLEAGRDAELGAVGEIWIRSPQVTVGYWNKPEETAASVDSDGWFKTGDAGYVDAENYLFIHDRVKDMIISGGENVYPAEVENVLMSCPGVADVAVIGVPSERWGETVKAIVVKAPGTDPQPAEIIAFARERLAHYKCPTSVDFAETLPRNPSGKILKRELRAPYWQNGDRSVS
jgi:long-chain acyl-CoA synthetase